MATLRLTTRLQQLIHRTDCVLAVLHDPISRVTPQCPEGGQW